jgi:prepilin-type N-terminal cleavage/methylation domain-containing protein
MNRSQFSTSRSLAGKRGFTLIELLVVIAIIGILSAVVLASLNTARAKGRDAARQTAIHNIQVALELYYSVNGRYPLSSGALSPNGSWSMSNDASWVTLASALQPYISKLPQDPAQSPTGWPGNGTFGVGPYGAQAFGYFSEGFGCSQQWYMLVWRPEASTVLSPGVTACDGTVFSTTNIGNGTVTVGVGR